LLIIAAVLLELVSVPLLYSFSIDLGLLPRSNLTDEIGNESSFWTLKGLVDTLFIADILVSTLTSYEGGGDDRCDVIRTFPETAINYHKSGMLYIDLISCVSVVEHFISTSGEQEITRILKGLKVVRLSRLSKLLKHKDSMKKASTFRLIRLLIGVVLISHVAACAWYAIARADKTSFWFDQMNIDSDSQDWERYSKAIFYSVGVLLGNFPTVLDSEGELIFTCFWGILGAAVQATVFGSVAVLLSSFDRDQLDFQVRRIPTHLLVHRVAHLLTLFAHSTLSEKNVPSIHSGQRSKTSWANLLSH
jgi:hypothetical protein